MAAEVIAETSFNILGEGTAVVSGEITETGDWILLDSQYPGTLGIVGSQCVTDGASAALVPSYAGMDAKADVTGTTTETFVYDGAVAGQRTSGGYYILNNTTGEYMYVISDDGTAAATGTVVVKRGALGSTAVAISENDEFHILNCIIFTSSAGFFHGEFRPLPSDPDVKLFA